MTDTVASPCINICRMNEASGLCEGCWRSLDEIAAWGGLDNAAKRAISAQLPLRQADAGATQPAAALNEARPA
jgi:uncharacterized protein